MLKYESIVNKFCRPTAEFSANDRPCAGRRAPLTKFRGSRNSSDRVLRQSAPNSSTRGLVTGVLSD
jgi:hypothetical protein